MLVLLHYSYLQVVVFDIVLLGLGFLRFRRRNLVPVVVVVVEERTDYSFN